MSNENKKQKPDLPKNFYQCFEGNQNIRTVWLSTVMGKYDIPKEIKNHLLKNVEDYHILELILKNSDPKDIAESINYLFLNEKLHSIVGFLEGYLKGHELYNIIDDKTLLEDHKKRQTYPYSDEWKTGMFFTLTIHLLAHKQNHSEYVPILMNRYIK